MKIVRWIAALTGGLILMMLAGITLGIESGLPFWRIALGLCFAASSLIVMDKCL